MLPIFQITGRAVWFVASNAFTLFRICWLPIAVLIATQYALAYGVAQVAPSLDLRTLKVDLPGEILPLGTAAAGLDLLLQGLALSVVAVAVHRIILFNDRKPDQYFLFPFGTTELLYVLMGALSFIIVLVTIVVLSMATMLMIEGTGGSITNSSGDPPLSPTLIVMGLVAYVSIVWLTLRLMVWPPAVVANNSLSFGEAWSLSKGNVLALLALTMASAVTFVAIGALVLIGASEAGAVEVLDLGKKFAFEDTFEARFGRVLEGRVNPHVIAFEFAFRFFMATYTVAVLSYAYKALKGFDIDLPIDGQVPEGVELEPGVKPMGKL